HQDAFLRPRLNACCRFSQRTFAGPPGNGRDAPIPAVRANTIDRLKSTQTRPSRPRQWVIGSARKRSFAPDSPLCGNRRLGQFVEQRLGLFEIGGVEAFGEPAEDWGEEGERLLRPALLSAQAGEARCGAQFPGLRVLPARDVDALLDGGLGLAGRPGAGEQGLAPEPIKLRFKRRSSRLLDRLQPGGDRRKHRFGLADRQLRIGLQRQQDMLARPKTVTVYSFANLGQPLLAFAGDAERPSVRAKGERVPLRDALLLADPQSPFPHS